MCNILLGYDAVSLVNGFTTFRHDVVASSSNVSKKLRPLCCTGMAATDPPWRGVIPQKKGVMGYTAARNLKTRTKATVLLWGIKSPSEFLQDADEALPPYLCA
jgi:hypothetical protein